MRVSQVSHARTACKPTELPPGPSLWRLARGRSRVLENKQLAIEPDIEPGVDQGNDGYDVLRIDDRPLLQRERILSEDKSYRSFAGIVGADEAYQDLIVAAFKTRDRQRAAGQRDLLVEQNARWRGSEWDVAHLLEIAVIVDEERTVGDDENGHRRLILHAKLAGS